MAFYYVKTGGTATGDAGRYATKQTGSFAGLGAANYYDNIDAAIAATTPVAEGDTIVCSNLYAFVTGSFILRTLPSGAGVTIISVDDTDIETYLSGASEQVGSNAGIETEGNVRYIGFTHTTPATIEASGNSNVIYIDSVAELTTSGDAVAAINDGARIEMIDSEINCGSTSNGIRASAGGTVSLRSVTITGSTITNLILQSYTIGGGVVRLEGCDLTNVTGTLNGDGGDQAFDDLVDVKIDMCKIANGVNRSVALSNYNQNVYVTRCSDSSTGHDYNYGYTGFSGDLDQDTATYRNEDPSTAESNVKLSYKIVTNTNCSKATPLVIKFPNPSYFELSGTAQDTLSLFITSNDTLTNDDFYVDVIYPDGTNKETPNKISSENTAYFTDGAALTTDATSTWTGGLANNYKVDLDTSGNPGADAEPIVTVTVTKPSTAINLGSIIEGS